MRLLLSTAAALALIAATPAAAQPRLDEPAGALALPSDAAGYARAAAQGDRFEIESSRLAVSHAKSAKVREFAQMMVEAHTASLSSLDVAVDQAGLSPVRTGSPGPLRATMDALQQASAYSTEFDDRYVAAQIQAHKEAVALHSNYVDKGDNPALRDYAVGAAVVAREHQQMLNNIGR